MSFSVPAPRTTSCRPKPPAAVCATLVSGFAFELFVLTLGPAECDVRILPLAVAGLGQTLAERSHSRCRLVGRPAADEPDHRHRRLLRARRERPRGRCAAEERDERAPRHVWMAPAW